MASEEQDSTNMDVKAVSSLRVVDLKHELDKRGLSKSGSKKDLVDRLKVQIQLEKLHEEAAATTVEGKVPNLGLQDDEVAGQNEFVKKYLAEQQKVFERQTEARKSIERDDSSSGEIDSDDETKSRSPARKRRSSLSDGSEKNSGGTNSEPPKLSRRKSSVATDDPDNKSSKLVDSESSPEKSSKRDGDEENMKKAEVKEDERSCEEDGPAPKPKEDENVDLKKKVDSESISKKSVADIKSGKLEAVCDEGSVSKLNKNLDEGGDSAKKEKLTKSVDLNNSHVLTVIDSSSDKVDIDVGSSKDVRKRRWDNKNKSESKQEVQTRVKDNKIKLKRRTSNQGSDQVGEQEGSVQSVLHEPETPTDTSRTRTSVTEHAESADNKNKNSHKSKVESSHIDRKLNEKKVDKTNDGDASAKLPKKSRPRKVNEKSAVKEKDGQDEKRTSRSKFRKNSRKSQSSSSSSSSSSSNSSSGSSSASSKSRSSSKSGSSSRSRSRSSSSSSSSSTTSSTSGAESDDGKKSKTGGKKTNATKDKTEHDQPSPEIKKPRGQNEKKSDEEKSPSVKDKTKHKQSPEIKKSRHIEKNLDPQVESQEESPSLKSKAKPEQRSEIKLRRQKEKNRDSHVKSDEDEPEHKSNFNEDIEVTDETDEKRNSGNKKRDVQSEDEMSPSMKKSKSDSKRQSSENKSETKNHAIDKYLSVSDDESKKFVDGVETEKQKKSTSSNEVSTEKSTDTPKTPEKIQRKRRWGSSTKNRNSRAPICISTRSLKGLLPEVKPTPVKIPSMEEEIVEKKSVDSTTSSRFSRTITQVVEEQNKVPQPKHESPKNPLSTVILISNLVRPFTIHQLKELLSKTGKVCEENGFWIDKIKSKCLVKYENKDGAIQTRNSLHDTKWPASNPKLLSVDYSTEEALSARLERVASPAAMIKPEKEKEKRHDRDRKRSQDKLSAPVREWDRHKLTQSPDRSDRHKRRRHSSSHDRRDESTTKEDEAPAKLLDDLFRKTKSTPCIYWLPLTDEQVIERIEERKKREIEREKRRQQRQLERNHPRPAPDRRRRSSSNRRRRTRSRSLPSRRH